jgi:membrane dipeptidase
MSRSSRHCLAILLILGAAGLAACAPRSVVLDEASLEARARALHARILSVDTHCDTPMMMLRGSFDMGQRHETGKPGSGLIDLPRMKEGCLDALFFGVFTGQGELSESGYARVKDLADRMIAAVDAMCAKYPDLVGKATTPADAYRIKAAGKRIAFLGMENGYPIGLDKSRVKAFAAKGIRYITLCHSGDNQICDSGTDRRDPQDRGLSDFGRQVVAECNRNGVMIDVSHISDKSFYDVLAASRTPIFASHSCCRALCDNPRNLSDDMIRALAAKGGVVQICFLTDYLRPVKPDPARDKAFQDLEAKYGPQRGLRNLSDEALRAKAMQEFQTVNQRFPREKASVKDVVDHVDHIVQLAGIDHAGFGTDFDGGGGLADCADASQMYRVTMELIRRGYHEKDIAKLWGGNIMRVLQKAIDGAE